MHSNDVRGGGGAGPFSNFIRRLTLLTTATGAVRFGVPWGTHFLRSGYTRLILPPAWPRNRRTPRRSARVRRSLASEIVRSRARMSALAAASACVCRAAPSGAPAARKIAASPERHPAPLRRRSRHPRAGHRRRPRRGPRPPLRLAARLLQPPDEGRARQEGVGAPHLRRDSLLRARRVFPQQQDQQRRARQGDRARHRRAGRPPAPVQVLPLPDADHHHPRVQRRRRRPAPLPPMPDPHHLARLARGERVQERPGLGRRGVLP